MAEFDEDARWHPDEGVPLGGGEHGEREVAARPERSPRFAQGIGRVRHQHEAGPTDDHVDGIVVPSVRPHKFGSAVPDTAGTCGEVQHDVAGLYASAIDQPVGDRAQTLIRPIRVGFASGSGRFRRSLPPTQQRPILAVDRDRSSTDRPLPGLPGNMEGRAVRPTEKDGCATLFDADDSNRIDAMWALTSWALRGIR